MNFIVGLVLLLMTLVDGVETILVPRRINHRFRFSRFYYRGGWAVWRAVAKRLQPKRFREGMLAIFGPISLLGLFASWMFTLVAAFALFQMSTARPLLGPHSASEPGGFWDCLYFSGTTCFTLGLGDLTPRHGIARFYTVAECAVGYGFLAIIISYLPVLYQAFSRREATISLMDARAGSPPSGGEFLVRIPRGTTEGVNDVLREWERWCAELLESHLSFPLLAFYRSQHGNQSWLASLTTMLDASALLLRLLPPDESYQAQLTFAMARHAAVDICLIFAIHPSPPGADRFPETIKEQLKARLGATRPGSPAAISPDSEPKLVELRAMYEPFLIALSNHFLLSLPPVWTDGHPADNWQRSAWMARTPGIGSLPSVAEKPTADHFSPLL